MSTVTAALYDEWGEQRGRLHDEGLLSQQQLGHRQDEQVHQQLKEPDEQVNQQQKESEEQVHQQLTEDKGWAGTRGQLESDEQVPQNKKNRMSKYISNKENRMNRYQKKTKNRTNRYQWAKKNRMNRYNRTERIGWTLNRYFRTNTIGWTGTTGQNIGWTVPEDKKNGMNRYHRTK